MEPEDISETYVLSNSFECPELKIIDMKILF